MTITEVVNNSEWQELRKSFLGTWRNNASENVVKLRNYLGDMRDKIKNRRVRNYLVGTAFRSRTIQSPDIDKLLSELRTIKEQRNG